MLNDESNSVFYALLSAFFAALTTIFAKIGVEAINPNLATAIRTLVILVMVWSWVLVRGQLDTILTITPKTLLFLVFSGLSTGLSWLFYFRALQLGKASLVAPLDKLSLVLVLIFSLIFLKEPLTLKVFLGTGLILIGTLVLIRQQKRFLSSSILLGELSQQADRTIIYTMLSIQIYYITLATIFVGISCLGICDTPAESLAPGNTKSTRERTLPSVNASEQNLHPTKVLEPLQTQISQRDMKIIEQLVAIAQGNSAQVRETKAGMGLNAFTDVISIEILPSLTNRNYISSSPSSENENSLSATITIDPIKLINTFTQQPIAVARWQEAKKQKRVAVVQYYLAYLQARQATQIATHKMKKFTHATVTSISSRTSTEVNMHQIDNPDYVTAATEMLGANTREQIALEELAACVGLSPEQAIAFVNER